MIPLEQNYRSTNTILRRRERGDRAQPRAEGEDASGRSSARASRCACVEVEDEHAEARFVAAEIAALVEEGYSADEIAVFYRTNAQSRVLEDVLVRQGIAYQVIGGPRFYERAEIKDAIAYLQVLDNPFDAVSLLRIANRPRRGIGDTSLARLQTYADAQRDLALGGDRPRRGGGRSAPRRCARSRLPHAAAVAPGGRAGARPCPSWSRRCSSGPATSRRSRPSARSRRRAGSRTSRSSSASRASTQQEAAGADAVAASSRRSRSTPTRTRSAASGASSR